MTQPNQIFNPIITSIFMHVMNSEYTYIRHTTTKTHGILSYINENIKLFVFLFEKYFCTLQNNIYPILFFDDIVLHKTFFYKQCNEPVAYINTTTEKYARKTNRVCKNTALPIPPQTPSHFHAFFYSLL